MNLEIWGRSAPTSAGYEGKFVADHAKDRGTKYRKPAGAEKTVFTPKELGAYHGFIGGVNGSDVKFMLVETPCSSLAI